MRTELVAGVDEAGRGALAGPVTAAAVILNHETQISGVADSKKLSKPRRHALAEEIRNHSVCWAIGIGTVEEIERHNILQATMMAMARAIEGLSIRPDVALIDGNRSPELSIPARTVIGGDDSVKEISAASIIAKTYRDDLMSEFALEYPQYGFNSHFGYGTARHMDALREYGACAIHRRSFAPVSRLSSKLF